MPCGTLGTYFFDGSSFTGATAIYTTSTLTTLAPDGYYSQGGVYRLQSGGLLGPVVPCPACTVPCGSIAGQGANGRFTLFVQLGSVSGAAVITFNTGAPNIELPVPDQLTWTYNGVSASEYSALLGGYMEGVIGSPDQLPGSFGTPCPPLPAAGIAPCVGIPVSTGTQYTYTGGVFVPGGVVTIGPYGGLSTGESTLINWNCTPGQSASPACAPCSTGGIAMPECVPGTLAAPNLPAGTNWPECGNETRNATMVVPSPPGVTSTILQIDVEAPCPGTWWALDVICPYELSGLPSSVEAGANPVCGMAITTEYYHVPVDKWGNTNPNSFYYDGGTFNPTGGGATANGQPDGTLGLHDWVFEDKYGQTPLPAGNYKMESPAASGVYYDVEVGVNTYTTCTSDPNRADYPPTGAVQAGIVKSMCVCP